MDQKEHVATLCALGTLGAAAAGLTFASDTVDLYSLRPGKRKWPGAYGDQHVSSSILPTAQRRSVTQPDTPVSSLGRPTTASHSILSTRLSSAPRLLGSSRDQSLYDEPSSRGSSTSRRSMLRPRTAASRSTVDKRESSISSGWLKRLSWYSSHNTSPSPSVIEERLDDGQPRDLRQRPATSATFMPNKLVKRSLSQRGLSRDEAQGHILKRPATSRQRSETFRDMLSRPVMHANDDANDGEMSSIDSLSPLPRSVAPHGWRAFFETGFPRKRRRSESAAEASQIRIVSVPTHCSPTLVLGSELDESQLTADIYDRPLPSSPNPSQAKSSLQRARQSLGSLRRVSRRRNFTAPSAEISSTAAHGTFSAPKSDTGPVLKFNGSPFDIQLPPGTPQFNSSPPISNSDRAHIFRPRLSISASDPPTTSSDADGHVFSDVESLDFQSDTAYDSIATRTTNASHYGMKDSKLETIFAARTSDELDIHHELWPDINRQIHHTDHEMEDAHFPVSAITTFGIGITLNDEKTTSASDDMVLATPPQSPSIHTEDFNATPVPHRFSPLVLSSSPPLLPASHTAKEYDHVGDMLEDMKLDGDGNDWRAAHDNTPGMFVESVPHAVMSSPGAADFDLVARFQEAQSLESENLMQRNSIFEWSEHQQISNCSRPKTVHGKQSNGDRSRSAGRKGPPQLHFRSQSVPVNREGANEDVPVTAKYQTWRLGHKPVSEEWSDDFEFDDIDLADKASSSIHKNKENLRDSVRSVKIPQSIMDRQPSVHLQFGQVQEFMALVEELKRLRVKGVALDILEGTAKHLWEDAESIINLATINDEETEAPILTSSPASSDPFADLGPVTGNATVSILRPRRPPTTGRRSVSTMTTPPVHGRARGESLAHARHFLEVMHQTRSGNESAPLSLELPKQKKLHFDTQDLKDLVIRSGAITRALKEEVRRAEGLSVSPQKTPTHDGGIRDGDDGHPLKKIFIAPQSEQSPCPPSRQPGLPKSRSANSYLDGSVSRQQLEPFSSPITLAAVV